jgi:hypothetical protein
LKKIADTDDLHISPFREDGMTYGTPTAMQQTRGRITAAGMTKDVRFEPVDDSINDRIDDVYRTKYKNSPYLQPMISTRSRSATAKIEPIES